jgi:tRNA pseudouridine13 synthase
MKLKQSPDDFRVEELPTVRPKPDGKSDGAFAFYRLVKRGWTTPDALEEIRNVWKVDRRRLTFAGLKDKHAHTIQYFTIHNGPPRQLNRNGLEVEHLGQLPQAYESEHSDGNRFVLTLRELTSGDVAQIERRIPILSAVGLVNYFDDQRFGSVTLDGRFIAKEMCLGRYEEAVRLALTGRSENDTPRQTQEKDRLIRHWGDWSACRAAVKASETRSALWFLEQRPGDFLGACVRLNPELTYLSAYQSHIWNRMLNAWIERHVPTEDRRTVPLKTTTVALPDRIDDTDWPTLDVPYPSARLKIDPSDDWVPILDAIMQDEGLPLERMKVGNERKPFFSKGTRPARVEVVDLCGTSGPDAPADGRPATLAKMELKFDLPRGAYATMVVKSLTAAM